MVFNLSRLGNHWARDALSCRESGDQSCNIKSHAGKKKRNQDYHFASVKDKGVESKLLLLLLESTPREVRGAHLERSAFYACGLVVGFCRRQWKKHRILQPSWSTIILNLGVKTIGINHFLKPIELTLRSGRWFIWELMVLSGKPDFIFLED